MAEGTVPRHEPRTGNWFFSSLESFDDECVAEADLERGTLTSIYTEGGGSPPLFSRKLASYFLVQK